MSTFSKLIQRSGGYALPFLINIYDDDRNINLFFINSNRSIVYDGNTYAAAAFKYSPNSSNYGYDGGGTLEINTQETQLTDIVERYNSIHLDVIGIIDEVGTITELKNYKHHYGKVSGNRKTFKFDFDADDRPAMTFPTLIWNTQNNRGNN